DAFVRAHLRQHIELRHTQVPAAQTALGQADVAPVGAREAGPQRDPQPPRRIGGLLRLVCLADLLHHALSFAPAHTSQVVSLENSLALKCLECQGSHGLTTRLALAATSPTPPPLQRERVFPEAPRALRERGWGEGL